MESRHVVSQHFTAKSWQLSPMIKSLSRHQSPGMSPEGREEGGGVIDFAISLHHPQTSEDATSL